MSLSKDLHNLLECSICLETFKDPKTLPCNHRYCKHCLQQQVEKSVTMNPNHNFSCPLCKRETKLLKQKPTQEWADIFESDRLLRDIIDRLSLENDVDENMCRHHQMKLEIICYNCNVIGCLRCALLNHKQCDQVEHLMKQVRIHNAKLESGLKDVDGLIIMTFAHSKCWTIAEKSFQNQIQYSRTFVEKQLKDRKLQYEKSLSVLLETVASYKESNIASRQSRSELDEVMDKLSVKLNIDNICDRAVEDAERRIDASFPNTPELTASTDVKRLQTISDQLADALKQDQENMIFLAKHIFAANEDLFSPTSVMNTKRRFSARPNTLLLKGLIVTGAQTQLDLSKQEEIMAEVLRLFNNQPSYHNLIIALRNICEPEGMVALQIENDTTNHNSQPLTRGSVFKSYRKPPRPRTSDTHRRFILSYPNGHIHVKSVSYEEGGPMKMCISRNSPTITSSETQSDHLWELIFWLFLLLRVLCEMSADVYQRFVNMYYGTDNQG